MEVTRVPKDKWDNLQALLNNKIAELRAKEICNKLLKISEAQSCKGLSFYEQFLVKLKYNKLYFK